MITDVGFRGNPPHASSVVKALAGAGQAIPPGRSIKRKLQLRYATHAIRNRGVWGCRASTKVAKAASAMKALLRAVAGTPGVRVTAWGERTGGVNWGPSGAGGLNPRCDGIIHKPAHGRQRRRCGHSKRRSGRTIQPVGEPRATGLAVVVRGLRCRLKRGQTITFPMAGLGAAVRLADMPRQLRDQSHNLCIALDRAPPRDINATANDAVPPIDTFTLLSTPARGGAEAALIAPDPPSSALVPVVTI